MDISIKPYIDSETGKIVNKVTKEEYKKLTKKQQDDEDNIWSVIDLFFKQDSILVNHLISSYNQFVSEGISSMITSSENIFYIDEFFDDKTGNTITVRNRLIYENICIGYPSVDSKHGIDEIIFPMLARKRNLTYSAKIMASIKQVQDIYTENELVSSTVLYSTYDTKDNQNKQIVIGRIPVMIHSEFCILQRNPEKESYECKYDPGGYFIINGNERVIVPQEKIGENRILITKKEEANMTSYIADIRCISANSDKFSRLVTVKYKKDLITISTSQFKNKNKDVEIPIFIFFRALGVETDKDIINMIIGSPKDPMMFNILKPSQENTKIVNEDSSETDILTKEEAITYLAKYLGRSIRILDKNDTSYYENKKKYLLNNEILKDELFCHIASNLKSKALYLSHIVNKLLSTVIGRRDVDDRDSYVNKRLELPGELLGQIFKQSFRRQLQDCTRIYKLKIEKNNPYSKFNIIPFIKSNTIDKGFKDALSTGFWGLQSGGRRGKKGVSQVLNIKTFLDKLGHLRRVVSPSSDSTTNKLIPPRKLHPTHWGYICPAEVPEGQKVGMVKNIALTTGISIDLMNQIDLIKDLLMNPIEKWRISSNSLDKVDIVIKSTTEDKLTMNYENDIIYNYVNNMNYRNNIEITKKGNTIILDCGKHEEIAKIILKRFKIINEKNISLVIPVEYVDYVEIFFYTKVILNGEWIGLTNEPEKLLFFLREKRFSNSINKYVSFYNNIKEKEIEINVDSGRCYRPLFVVKDNKLLLTDKIIKEVKSNKIKTWDELIYKYHDIIEYIDVTESSTLIVCNKYDELKYNDYNQHKKLTKEDLTSLNRYGPYVYKHITHCELHPSLILGVVASNIPFPDHNQAPRNTYQCAQAKQAIGVYATNYLGRMDKMGHILYYPQKPLVVTRNMKYISTNELPSGQNAIVAIMSYTGYNQEDGIIFNKSSVERGLFVSAHYRKFQEILQKNPNTGELDKFIKPDPNIVSGIKNANYDKLESNGLVKLEEHVTEKDIIIGKVVSKVKQNINDKKYKDASQTLRSSEDGIIDTVMTGIYNQDGNEMCKIKIRTQRNPQIGDKFSSRAGQKGVIGMMYKMENMPFTESGIVPDLIITPNAIPSRMTVGQLLECVLGKVGCISGTESDATPFNRLDIDAITEKLEQNGFNKYGNEPMYCGFTGKKLKTQIFIGPTYYQRLKHMVIDKSHSRARGPRTILTRQPVDGRARDGGLRFGEMERDCMIAHGAAQFLKERLLDSSDNYFVHVCDNCGLFATKLKDKNVYECKKCNNHSHVSLVLIPYASKLLFQELLAMTITPRIITANSTFS